MFYSPKEKTGKAGMQATLMALAVCTASLGIGTVSVIFAPSAQSATKIEPRSKIVRYGDLNLASAQGRDALDRRIRRAAKQVCVETGMPAVWQHRKERKCIVAAHESAWAIAQQKIQNHRLAARGIE